MARMRVLLAATVAAGLLFPAPPAGAAAKVRNGGFELGTFKAWRRADRGDGRWRIYSETSFPTPTGGGEAFPPPPQGEFAAVTIQGGPGAHLLHRVVRLAPGQRHILEFLIYWRNSADRWVPRRSFAFDGLASTRLQGGAGPANQQFRIQVMRPGAPLWSLNKKHVLANVFRSKRDTRLRRLKPKKVTYDLTKFAGRRVRLRFAEVDNLGELNVAIDRVRIVG